MPAGAELVVRRRIPLKDDIVNRAEVQNKQANAAKMFADGGWEPLDHRRLDADDLARLVHSGPRPCRCRPRRGPAGAERRPARTGRRDGRSV